MSSFKADMPNGWPNLDNLERVTRFDRAECDTVDYFGDWSQRWGEDVSQSVVLYRPKEPVASVEQASDFYETYVVILKISTAFPDAQATEDYIKHQENLCYPLPWKSNVSGRAKFLGASTYYKNGKGFTQLVFLIYDPRFRTTTPILN